MEKRTKRKEDGEDRRRRWEQEKDTMIQLRDRPELAHQNIYTTEGASQAKARAVAVAAPGHLAMEME
jgi:hypothetical protein